MPTTPTGATRRRARNEVGSPAAAHANRYRQIVRIMADEGFGSVADHLGLTKLAPLREAVRRVSPETGVNVPVEVRTRMTFERLGPTFIKIGQALSTRTDIIPPSFARELAKLQDDVKPMPFEHAEDVIQREFGMGVDEVFASFNREPLAAASIGQVHPATLADGTEVAVKVQRPHVREQILLDLEILRGHADRLTDYTEYGAQLNASAIADEFGRTLREELDYVNEARNAERLRRAFDGDETVFFPKVFWEFTTPRVLTLERVRGIPLNRGDLIDEAGIDRSDLARRGMYLYLRQIFDLGFYQADPHPGNLFVMPDGQVALTDFGRTSTLSDRSRDQIADLFVAIVDNDEDRAVDTLLEASKYRVADIDRQQLSLEVSRLISKYYNAKLGEIEIGELITEVLDLTRVNGLGLPSDIAVLLATLTVLEGVGCQLDPEFDFVAVTSPFAKRIVAEQLAPDNVSRQVFRNVRSAVKMLGSLPEALQRFMNAASAGEFRLTVRPGGWEPILNRAEALVNRLAFAIVVSAFILGFSVLLSRTPIPTYFVWFARAALLISAFVGAWFFLAIFVSRYRRK